MDFFVDCNSFSISVVWHQSDQYNKDNVHIQKVSYKYYKDCSNSGNTSNKSCSKA